MIYKLADTDEEFEFVAKIYESESGYVPNFENSRVVLGIQDGVILGFTMIQPAIHVEPTWVTPDSRGKVNVLELVKNAVNLVEGLPAYVFTTRPGMNKLLERLKFKELPWKVMIKD